MQYFNTAVLCWVVFQCNGSAGSLRDLIWYERLRSWEAQKEGVNERGAGGIGNGLPPRC